jgi:mono/diheme cytochrome c family protein
VRAGLLFALALGVMTGTAACRRASLPQADRAGRDLVAGRKIFERKCARCHDRSGSGRSNVIDRFPFVNLVDGVWRSDGSPESIERQVRTGHNPMPGFEGKLTEEEIQQTVAYVLTLPHARTGETAPSPGP